MPLKKITITVEQIEGTHVHDFVTARVVHAVANDIDYWANVRAVIVDAVTVREADKFEIVVTAD